MKPSVQKAGGIVFRSGANGAHGLRSQPQEVDVIPNQQMPVRQLPGSTQNPIHTQAAGNPLIYYFVFWRLMVKDRYINPYKPGYYAKQILILNRESRSYHPNS
jgi:hypothetical protein